MKISSLFALILISLAVNSHGQTSGSASPGNLPAPTPWAVISRTANSAIWQRTTYEQVPDGRILPHVHRYTELASGLNYLSNGQWIPSQEQIESYPGGAVARQGQYQVIFANNLNTAGSIDMQTPDGKRLRSNILGLMYHDTASGQAVLIAQIQDSTGELISSNEVLYTNAFQGVKADVRYTYKKGKFEQDVILREQPPSPGSLGMNPDTTELEVITEFLNPPPATVSADTLQIDGETDQNVSWGATRLGRGRAFDLGQTNNLQSLVSVIRQYVTVQGQTVLLEKVPLKAIQSSLQRLPLQASVHFKRPKVAFGMPPLPPIPPTQAKPEPIKLAAATPSNKGYVLDYMTLNTDQNGYTFQADTTYYVSGWINFSSPGTVIIEGGTVIKFASGAALNVMTDVSCDTSPYRPAVLTAKDDNTVGESITGSSGIPSGTYAYYALLEGANNLTPIQNLRVMYADYGVSSFSSSNPDIIRDCQFINDTVAIAPSDNVAVDNVLFDNVGTAFDSFGATTVNATFITAHNVNTLNSGETLNITNSLFVCVTNFGASVSGGYNGTNSSDAGVFQIVGGGSHYLATNSVYRDAGTTNIDPAILADIATKTTYPPIAYTNVTFTTAQTFSPRAQRDTDTPDLGYHYDPLDYDFGGCIADSNMTFTAGTAVGWFRTTSGGGPQSGQGIYMQDYTTANFQGTEQSPDYWVRLSTVQERDTTGGHGPGGITGGDYLQNSNTIVPAPVINLSFTRCSVLINEANHFRDGYYGALIVRANDCEFYGGGLGGYCITCCLTNCLVDRLNSLAEDQGMAGNEYVLQNCTCLGGSVYFVPTNPVPLIVRDCAFDGTTFTLQNYGTGTNTDYDYNAYTNGAPQLSGSGTNDVIVTNSYNWQTNWLGNYYLPSDSLLIDAGDTNADQLGLYHFTTQTNQIPETNSTVDIGYHYVAVDTNGNPLDTDGDGIPDYIEDANGNGVYDSGDLSDWTDYYNGILPTLSIVSGNNQSGMPGTFLRSPLVVSVTDTNGLALTNAPLTFAVTQGGAQIAAATNETLATNLDLRTDHYGEASVLVFLPSALNTTNYIRATVTSGTNSMYVTFIATTMEGLRLWLRADLGVTNNSSGQISAWADQSGNGNNATQSNTGYEPLYVTNAINGLPVVQFNPSYDQYFNLPDVLSGTTGAEAFVVLKITALTGTWQALWEFGSKESTHYPDNNGQIQDDFGSTGYYSLGNPAQPLTQYHVYEVSSQSNNWAAWINGVLQCSSTADTYYINTSPTLGYSPSPGYSSGNYFYGDIAEVLVFGRTLSSQECLVVNEYLNSKYGLVASVPPTPTNLVADAISTNQISLTWSEVLTNGGATQISIERSTNSTGPFTEVTRVADALSYVDTNLAAGMTYYYQVRAINLTSWSPYSNEALATTLTNGVSLPLDNLALWLKADSGLTKTGTSSPVSFWADQSGNGNNATQTTGSQQPTWIANGLNGLPVVQFNPSYDQYFNLPDVLSGTTGAEAFVVLKVTALTGTWQALWEFGSKESTHYPDNNGQIQDDFGSTGYYSVGNPTQPLTQYHVYEVSSQSNNWAAWINGVLQFSSTTDTYYINTSPTLGYSPSPGYSSGNYFYGDIAEVMIFGRTLTGEEKDAVGGYLVSKYDLSTNSFPPTAPTNLVATGLTPYRLNLQWQPTSTNPVTFHIERKLVMGETYQEIGSVPAYVSNFIDTTAIPTNQYYYQVRVSSGFGGDSAYSTAISPPTVSLASWPSTIIQGFTNVIEVQTADAGGTITQVAFYAGNTCFGTATSAPYTINWIPTFAGTFVVDALATDSLGNSQYSEPVTVNIYLDSNGDGIPDYLQVSEGNDPLNPWVAPSSDTNTNPPDIFLYIPTNATLLSP